MEDKLPCQLFSKRNLEILVSSIEKPNMFKVLIHFILHVSYPFTMLFNKVATTVFQKWIMFTLLTLLKLKEEWEVNGKGEEANEVD
jgi:hypothetical protein